MCATGLDSAARRVRPSDDTAVGYDDPVIATGARARRLPGTEGIAGVHVLRTLDDAAALRTAIDMSSRLVIVGAGFLGAEVAAVAAGRGVDVTLVSDVPAPLADVLGPELGGMLMDIHAAHGVRVGRRRTGDTAPTTGYAPSSASNKPRALRQARVLITNHAHWDEALPRPAHQ